MRRKVVLLLLLAGAGPLLASRIVIDRPSVRVGEAFEVTIELDGAAASAERFPIPLSRIELRGTPSVARQFQWINGRASQSKVLTYQAVAVSEGTGSVGPIRIEADGEGVVLPAATIRIEPPLPRGSGDAAAALRSMAAGAREEVVLDVEADRTRAVVGEQIVVTWTVYARESITSPAITELPDLPGFWVEEIPLVADHATTAILDGEVVTKRILRRLALFPLRSGATEVGPLEVRVGVFRSVDPFGLGRPLNSTVVNVVRSSPPLRLEIAPLPAEAEAVGAFELACSDPVAFGGGPASFDVTLEGDGNLRPVGPPRFGLSGAAVEIEERELEIDRGAERIRMRKRWTVLIARPEGRGLDLPPLELRAWNPARRRIEVLRCDPGEVRVARAGSAPAAPPRRRAGRPGPPERASFAAPVAAGVLIVAGGTAWLMAARRRSRLRPIEERILANRETPRAMREEARALVRERAIDPDLLYRADTPLADAYRALSSLIDVLEKEPWEKERSDDDLRRRVREFVRRL